MVLETTYAVLLATADERVIELASDPPRRVVVRLRGPASLRAVHVLAPICHAAHLPLDSAMRLNAELPFGALAVDATHLVFCQSLLLEPLTATTLRRVVRVVAQRAEELRHAPLARPRTVDVDLFAI